MPRSSYIFAIIAGKITVFREKKSNLINDNFRTLKYDTTNIYTALKIESKEVRVLSFIFP